MKSPDHPTVAQKIWRLLTPPERKSTVVLLALMLIGMGLETTGVGLILPALVLLNQVDYATKFPGLQPFLQVLGNPGRETLVVGGMLLLLAIYLTKSLFLAFLAWRQNHFVFDVQAQLSQRFFELYLRQPYTFHLRRNSAQLIRTTTEEIGLFTSGVITPTLLLLTESLVLLGLSALLVSVEPMGALLVGGVLTLTSWGFYRSTRNRIVRWGEAGQHHGRQALQHLMQGLGGAKEIKLLGRESEFLGRYRSHNSEYIRFSRLQSTLQQLPRLWLELLAVGGITALVLIMLAQNRSLDVILPTLGLFAAAAFRVLPSVNRVLGAAQSLKFGLPAIDTLYTELSLLTPSMDSRTSKFLSFQNMLELDGVSYAYPGAASIALKNVTLSIANGETIGVVGSSGAGKSTLVDMVLGLLAPDSGDVRVDGISIQQGLRHWQDQIGYVPQVIYLTDDTLRRNVAFGLPDAIIDEGAVRHAVQAAQLEGFINSLPQGLDTLVGERGVRLSGGQRQRIGIARALYHNPAVLVLDEATSALDRETEKGVMEAVHLLRGSKTLIIVAHRLSTVEHCDRLYRLENGQLVEQGSYAQVVNS